MGKVINLRENKKFLNGKDAVKLASGALLTAGVKRVLKQELGWTVFTSDKILDRIVTGAGLWGICITVSDHVVDHIDAKIDRLAEIIATAMDRFEVEENEDGTKTVLFRKDDEEDPLDIDFDEEGF